MKTTSKLKRKVLMLSTLSILGLTHLKAQDKITLLNGKEINAKVIEVSETEIKYKQQGVSDGPIWVLAKMNVFSILYPNGTKDVFEIIPAVVKPEKNSDYVYYNSFLEQSIQLCINIPDNFSKMFSIFLKIDVIDRYNQQFSFFITIDPLVVIFI